MRTLIAVVVALLARGTTAQAAEPPYAKLARILGTPQLAHAEQPRDKSRLLLQFVRPGESLAHWTKLTTVSIVVVNRPETQPATYGVIDRFKRELAQRHVRIDTFDLKPIKPYSVFFSYQGNGQRDQGIAYSPATGFVTIAQVAEKKKGTISTNDVRFLKSVIGR